MTTTPTQLSPALDDQNTLESAIDCLSMHLPISMEGGYTVRELFEILVRAASRGESIEQTTRALKGTPSSKGVRYHLEKMADMATLEQQLNTALHSRIPSKIRSAYHRIAIDLHLIAFPTVSEAITTVNSLSVQAATCEVCGYIGCSTRPLPHQSQSLCRLP